MLPLGCLQDILNALEASFETEHATEYTFEINPDGVDVAYLDGLRRLGLTRLSIGIQSFLEADLQWMRRAHTAEEAASIIPLVRNAGFTNFSIDLIFGLPQQPAGQWTRNLEQAIALDVPHLSTYGLTIEPKTPLFKQVQHGLVTPATDADVGAQYRETMAFLEDAGYEHYEVSSFARPGCRSQHNQQYWTHANYLGFGPSAHSFWWDGATAERWANVRNLRAYNASLETNDSMIDHRETLTKSQLADEYLLLRLRTRDGLESTLAQNRYGLNLRAQDALDALIQEGLMEEDAGRYRLTPAGFAVCDAVTAQLLN